MVFHAADDLGTASFLRFVETGLPALRRRLGDVVLDPLSQRLVLALNVQLETLHGRVMEEGRVMPSVGGD